MMRSLETLGVPSVQDETWLSLVWSHLALLRDYAVGVFMHTGISKDTRP
jgi:hypothetical protein